MRQAAKVKYDFELQQLVGRYSNDWVEKGQGSFTHSHMHSLMCTCQWQGTEVIEVEAGRAGLCFLSPFLLFPRIFSDVL